MLASIAISTTATQSPVIVPRVSPPTASSFTPMLASHADLLNSPFGYVSISRASQEATLFTDGM